MSFIEEGGPDAEIQHQPKAAKRKAATAGSSPRPAKSGRVSSSEANVNGGDFIVELGELKRVTVSVFKGAVKVDIREMYEVRVRLRSVIGIRGGF